MTPPTTLILILSLLSVAVSGLNCLLGQIEKGGSCQDCPPGTYSDKVGATSCKNCPPGTFNPHPRAPDQQVCRYCFEDTFSATPGATECTPCPSGTFSSRGDSRCLACGPGFELNPIGGTTRCTPCEPGSYSSRSSNRECEQCPSFETSPEGSKSITSCKKCPPGRFGGSCTQCFRGWVWNAETGGCQRCTPGTISKPGATKCKKCRAGRFAHFGRKRPRGSIIWFCKECPAGTTSNKGATTCRVAGEACEEGYFENKDKNCDKCEFGYFLNAKKKVCEKCPPGSVSRGGLRTSCEKCDGERNRISRDAVCSCTDGKYFEDGKCKDCPAGNEGSFTSPPIFSSPSHKPIDACFKCTAGTFSDKPGSTSCRECPFGTVAEKNGATKCTSCPKGTVPSFDTAEERRKCVRIATGCPLGYDFDVFWGSFCKKV